MNKPLIVDIDGDLLVQGSTFISGDQMVLLVGGDIRDTGAGNLQVKQTSSDVFDEQITQVEHRESGIIDTRIETTTTRTDAYETDFVWTVAGFWVGQHAFKQAKDIFPIHIGGALVDPNIPTMLQKFGRPNPWPHYIGNTLDSSISISQSFFGESD